jgi:hypothetical protein
VLGRGFPVAHTARLIRAGLATDPVPKRRSGRGQVARVRITDARGSMLAHCAAQFERKYGLVGVSATHPAVRCATAPSRSASIATALRSVVCSGRCGRRSGNGPALMIDLVIIRPILAVERDGAPEGEVIKAPAVPLP